MKYTQMHDISLKGKTLGRIRGNSIPFIYIFKTYKVMLHIVHECLYLNKIQWHSWERETASSQPCLFCGGREPKETCTCRGKKSSFPKKKKIETKISKFLLFLIFVSMSVSGIIFCTLLYFLPFFFYQPTHVFNNFEQNITKRKI